MFSSDLEYKTLSYALVGLLGLLVWAVAYWRIFKNGNYGLHRKGKTKRDIPIPEQQRRHAHKAGDLETHKKIQL